MSDELVIDTSLLVAFVDERDKFHPAAVALGSAIRSANMAEVYFDCVLVEAVGVLGRRAEEQKRSDRLSALLDSLEQKISIDKVTWIGHTLPQHYAEIMNLVRQTQGRLNFNDGLIAVLCREFNLATIASFDQDFDQITWLKRIAKPEDLRPT